MSRPPKTQSSSRSWRNQPSWSLAARWGCFEAVRSERQFTVALLLDVDAGVASSSDRRRTKTFG